MTKPSLALMLLPILASGSSRVSAQAVRQSFDLVVPDPPTPVSVGGETHLVYELHITSFARADLDLTGIEVMDRDHPEKPIANFRDEALAGILGSSGIPSQGVDRRIVPPGLRAIAYFWIPIQPPSAVPSALVHRVSFREGSSEAVVGAGAVTVREEEPVTLGPPLRGGPWVAVYGPEMERGHRRVLFALDGRVRIPARYAIDWIRVDEEGRTARGDASRIENWLGYGAEVLAVADAAVVAVRSSEAESPTLSNVKHGLENASGNHITLDLGSGRYVTYEHLKPGSPRVGVGDRVREGEVVAELGYSGDSTGPHLHIHVSDGASPLAGEGMPWTIRNVRVLGSYPSIAAFAAGGAWTPLAPGVSTTRSSEHPAPNTVVDFGSSLRN